MKKKLNKNFTTKTDDLKAYITCSCPLCGCGCDDIHSPTSVQSATNVGKKAVVQDQSSYFNR